MLRPTKRDSKIEIEMPNPRSDPHLCISAVEKGMSHYVRNRAHVWSTKEVQIIDRFKSAEISAKCAKARFQCIWTIHYVSVSGGKHRTCHKPHKQGYVILFLCLKCSKENLQIDLFKNLEPRFIHSQFFLQIASLNR